MHPDERQYWEEKTREAQTELEKTLLAQFLPALLRYSHVHNPAFDTNQEQLVVSLGLLNKKYNKLNVAWVIHTRGINLRYLGELYKLLNAHILNLPSTSTEIPIAFNAKRLILCEVQESRTPA